jgi:hypothetical protein
MRRGPPSFFAKLMSVLFALSSPGFIDTAVDIKTMAHTACIPWDSPQGTQAGARNARSGVHAVCVCALWRCRLRCCRSNSNQQYHVLQHLCCHGCSKCYWHFKYQAPAVSQQRMDLCRNNQRQWGYNRSYPHPLSP